MKKKTTIYFKYEYLAEMVLAVVLMTLLTFTGLQNKTEKQDLETKIINLEAQKRLMRINLINWQIATTSYNITAIDEYKRHHGSTTAYADQIITYRSNKTYQYIKWCMTLQRLQRELENLIKKAR